MYYFLALKNTQRYHVLIAKKYSSIIKDNEVKNWIKMNTAADRDRRQLIGATRGRDLYWGFSIGVFANLVTLYMIIQGGDLPQLAMTAVIVGVFVFVMINSFDCMDDFKASIADMDEEEAETNIGKKFKAAPWGLFKVVITLIFGAIAITQLMEVW